MFRRKGWKCQLTVMNHVRAGVERNIKSAAST